MTDVETLEEGVEDVEANKVATHTRYRRALPHATCSANKINFSSESFYGKSGT